VNHNFVLLAPTISPTAFAVRAAESLGHGSQVPESLADRVIAGTAVAAAGETVTTTFRTPRRPGRYVYLCSVPGQCGVGLTGVLEVE
jgi:hypothetical protein